MITPTMMPAITAASSRLNSSETKATPPVIICATKNPIEIAALTTSPMMATTLAAARKFTVVVFMAWATPYLNVPVKFALYRPSAASRTPFTLMAKFMALSAVKTISSPEAPVKIA